MLKTEKILIKKLNANAILPQYATPNSAGADLYCCIEAPILLKAGSTCMVPTGIAIAICEGYEVQIRSRSGLSAKNGIFVLNGVGTIDSDYRGELKVILANFSQTDFVIENQMRIAQMVLTTYTKATFELTTELDTTQRGEGGFGSSGVKTLPTNNS